MVYNSIYPASDSHDDVARLVRVRSAVQMKVVSAKIMRTSGGRDDSIGFGYSKPSFDRESGNPEINICIRAKIKLK